MTPPRHDDEAPPDQTERRSGRIDLYTLHQENRDRLDALQKGHEVLVRNQESMRASIDDLATRIEAHEHDGEIVTRDLARMTVDLGRINVALFDEKGNSHLAQIIDLMTTLRMNGKFVAWIAVVIGGLGAGVGALWGKVFH